MALRAAKAAVAFALLTCASALRRPPVVRDARACQTFQDLLDHIDSIATEPDDGARTEREVTYTTAVAAAAASVTALARFGGCEYSLLDLTGF